MIESTAEPVDVVETLTAYDTVAVNYEQRLRDALADSPWERAVLGAFAEMVGPGAPVADLGCGPGRITGYLAGLGLDAFGVDLSPGMIEVARGRHPELRFEVGSMAALPIDDESLAGATAWYSIIHTPPQRLPALFGELARVLRPGGVLAVAFQVGDEPRHLTHGDGHEISLSFYRLQPEFVAELMTDAGLDVLVRLVQRTDPNAPTPQANLIAGKPAA